MWLCVVALRHDGPAVLLRQVGAARHVELKRLQNVGLVSFGGKNGRQRRGCEHLLPCARRDGCSGTHSPAQ